VKELSDELLGVFRTMLSGISLDELSAELSAELPVGLSAVRWTELSDEP
jgi:hypothetical protein